MPAGQVSRRPNLAGLSGVCLAALLAVVFGLHAQGKDPPKQPEPPKPTDADGTVLSVGAQGVMLNNRENKTVTAIVTGRTSVRVTGAATANALQAKGGRSKLCVEFKADLAEGGKAKASISRLAIISAGPGRPMGLLPESAAFQGPPLGAALPGKPGGGGDLFGPPEGGKGGHKARGKDADGLDLGVSTPAGSGGPLKPPCACTVRGTVKSCHGNSISVLAGRHNVTAELADNAQIEIDVADLSIASHGDKIVAKGLTTPRPGVMLAESVEITLSQPYSGGGGRKHAPAKTAKAEKTAARPAKKAAPPEPAEKKEEPAEAKSGDEPKAKTKAKAKVEDEY